MAMYITFIAVWVIATVMIYNSITIRNNPLINLHLFKNTIYNEIYLLSHGIPFKYFVEEDDDLTYKGEILLKKIQDAGFDKNFTVRSYMAFKVMFMMACIAISCGIIIIMKYSSFFIKVFFNIVTPVVGLSLTAVFLVVSLGFAVSLTPGFILSLKVKKTIVANNKDIPVLQMFIILMLRSNKTIVEILFALSKINTNHKEVFEQGYRMYLRNKQEGLTFLKSHFSNSNERFVETFNLLEDVGEYAREECIRILESNMRSIVDETNTIKRRNDMARLLYSQASLIIPLVALLTLGVLPVVVMGLKLFLKSGIGG